MDLRIMTEPQQGATYDDLLAVARTSEELGFSAFFRSDHVLRIGDGDPGPGSTDAWTTLAGLARETSTIRLGTMVTSATFRRPGPLALTVATVDQMSGGRVELGLGTGWFEREHDAFGIPFGTWQERFDRFEEQLQILTGLWHTPEGETFSHRGAHYTLTDNPGLPKPVQRPRPPVIIGGHGTRRTPRLAATYADEFNIPFADVERAGPQYDRVRAACEDAGRDPADLVCSKALVLCVGRDEAEFRRRLEVIGHDEEQIREGQAAGTVQQVVDRIGEYAELGVTRVYLQVLDLHDLDHLRLVAEEVVPAVR